MNKKQFIRDYLTFTRKERVGLLALVIVTVIVILAPGFVRTSGFKHVTKDTAWISAMKRLEGKDSLINKPEEFKPGTGERGYAYRFESSENVSPVSELFQFDPNTLDEAGWQKLGLRNKTVHTIKNFLAHGGHFYVAEDLKKIYGLAPNDFIRLQPYIRIQKPAKTNEVGDYPKKEFESRTFSPRQIEINGADTAAFISLPGIGGKLAARIVNFRERLGGFYAIEQVGETYGLPDSTFQKIRKYLIIKTEALRKININTSTIDDLKVHPYIKFAIANPIVSYRNEHGAFKNIEDIRKVMAVTNEVYNKIAPYLTTQ